MVCFAQYGVLARIADGLHAGIIPVTGGVVDRSGTEDTSTGFAADQVRLATLIQSLTMDAVPGDPRPAVHAVMVTDTA